jgi:two-component system sensor histidine kinase DegS
MLGLLFRPNLSAGAKENAVVRDEHKTKDSLIEELVDLRRQVAQLRAGETNILASQQAWKPSPQVECSEEEIIAQALGCVAREIHSGVAQDLAAVHMRMSVWRHLVGGDPDRMDAEVEELKGQLGTSIRRLRRLIFILRPVVASGEDEFYSALNALACDFAEQYEVQVELQLQGPESRLPSTMERLLFRSLRETLHNVGRHANADTVWIELELQPPDRVILSVRDNGAGFDQVVLEDSQENRCVGLNRLRRRVEWFGGAFVLHSQPGQGTKVRVILPLSESREI